MIISQPPSSFSSSSPNVIQDEWPPVFELPIVYESSTVCPPKSSTKSETKHCLNTEDITSPVSKLRDRLSFPFSLYSKAYNNLESDGKQTSVLRPPSSVSGISEERQVPEASHEQLNNESDIDHHGSCLQMCTSKRTVFYCQNNAKENIMSISMSRHLGEGIAPTDSDVETKDSSLSFRSKASPREGLMRSRIPEKLSESLVNSSLIDEREKDLERLELKLDSQLEHLQSAIDILTKQVQTAFKSLHARVDTLQESLEASYNLGWRSLKYHLNQQGLMAAHKKEESMMSLTTCLSSTHPLQGAAEIAREETRILSGLLIVEKDADLMSVRDFRDRQAMLLRMIGPYLKKPFFEQFWHMKHGVDYCVSSILFKASHVLALTRSVVEGSAASNNSVEVYEEVQFKRFCKKGMKTLEVFAERGEEKWSAHLKSQFVTASKRVWMLQSMVAAAMSVHQVEILQHEPGTKFDLVNMDPLDFNLGDYFQSRVQFTVFPGFKIDNEIIIKPQVYLYPKGF